MVEDKEDNTTSPIETIERVSRNFQKEAVEERLQNQSQNIYNRGKSQSDDEDEEEDTRLLRPADFNPSNSIDVAHLLLSPSEMTSFMPELDKEIKLSNLNREEKTSIWEFQSVWEDIMWVRENQKRKLEEFEEKYGNYAELNPEDYQLYKITMTNINESVPDIFDSLSTLRKSQRVPVLSRGKGGFERRMQIQTINTFHDSDKDISEEKPGFLSKITGGFKK